MEQIDLAKFNFDVDDIVKGAAELKKAINDIKKDQDILKKAGKGSSIAFVENEATLKALNKEYNLHIKTLADSQKEAQKAAIKEQLLEAVLGKEVKTIKQAREQNKLLNELRNDADLEEQTELLGQLNDQLNRNNDLIRENVDAYTQQKINVGNYKDSIVEAFEEVNIFSGGLQNLGGNLLRVAGNSKEAGGSSKLMGNALGGAAKGVWGLTKASLAFIATPVGAVIAVLVGAFLLIKNAMNRSEESTNKLTKAFAPLQGIINGVLAVLEPLGDFLIDGIVGAMELATAAIFEIQEAFADLLSFLGFETAANNVRDFNDSLKSAAAGAASLAEAEAELVKMQRKARLTQLEYQKDAEKLRQERDNEQLSITKRIEANEKLGVVLEQQLQDELAIAQTALKVANLRAAAEGESAAVLDEQAAALETIADIEERINSQRSEQLTNRVSLLKEAEEKRQEAIDKTLKKMEEELALFVAQQGIRAKTLEQEIAQEKAVSELRKKILDEELAAKRISQLEYETEITNMRNEFGAKQAELFIENAARELEAYKQVVTEKLEAEEFLSDEVLAQRIAQNDAILAQEREFHELRLEQGVIDQNEFDAIIREAKETNRLTNKALDEEREAVEKEERLALRAIEFEEEIARMLEEKATQLEIENEVATQNKEIALTRLEEERIDGLISEELYQKRLAQIDRKYKEGEKQRAEILRDQKIDAVAGVFNAAAGIIDKNSAAGKAIALAQAGINTYQGISAGVKLGYPAALPAVAFASLTGFKAVKDIAKSKVPSAKGSGSVGGGGAVGSSGGGGGINLTGSGINLTEIASSNNRAVQDQIESNSNGRNIEEAVERGAAAGARTGTEQGSQVGIENLTDNRDIQQQSSF